MAGEGFDFTLEVRRGGALLECAPASLSVCFEDVLFQGVLEGRLPNDGRMPEFSVAPRWKDSASSTVTGLDVSYEDTPLGSYEREVFAPQARALITELVRKKRLEQGDSVDWTLVAQPPDSGTGPRFAVRARRTPYPFREKPLPGALPGSFAIEIDAGVIERVRKQVVASGAIECAGLLVGHLHRDPERKAGALEITDAIDVAAGDGGASGAHFAFGVDSFRSARRAAEARGDGAIPEIGRASCRERV